MLREPAAMRDGSVRRAVLVVVLFAGPAAAWVHQVSERGARLHWVSPRLTWHLSGGVPGVQDPTAAVRTALNRWAQPDCTGLEFTAVPGPTADVVIRHIASGWTRRPGLVAYTTVRSTAIDGRILSVIIELNGAHTFTASPATPKAAVDLESVITHELGHALGFGHSRIRAAVMYAGIKPGQQRRQLHSDDKEAVCAVYPKG